MVRPLSLKDNMIKRLFLLFGCACLILGAYLFYKNGFHRREKTISVCCQNVPARSYPIEYDSLSSDKSISDNHENMVLIPSGEFTMGCSDDQGRSDEYPRHRVRLDSFWIDKSEVTNAQFKNFVDATGYVTTAEKKPDWNEIKKQLPPDTPKPDDSLLVPSSLVFRPSKDIVSLNDPSQWWQWTKGADWRHPQGPLSNINDKENYPVVQISWYDAQVYAKWCGKRLPTEAEWEYAARGGLIDQPYSWGTEAVDKNKMKANIWQGSFPDQNTKQDGFENIAPVKSFPPNPFGLYDMAGNVWEWCSDWYHADYFQSIKGITSFSPKGPVESYDPDEPTIPKKVVRGGSFLCHASYCSSYRVSARMKTSPDTGLEHTGFRCVSDIK